MLLTAPALILATYIRAQGLMATPAAGATWPLYVSRMPDTSDTPTNCGVLYDVAGVKDGRIMSGGEVIQHFGIRLRIRCSAHITGWVKAEAIANNLDSVQNEALAVGGNNYQISNVSRVGLIVALGNEPGTKERALFECNFLVTIKIVT